MTLAAPNYFEQFRKIRKVLNILAVIGGFIVLAGIGKFALGVIASVLTGGEQAAGTGGAVLLWIACAAVLAIIFIRRIRVLSLQFLSTMGQSVFGVVSVIGGAVNRLVGRFIPTSITEKLFNGNRSIRLLLPAQSSQLDPAIMERFPRKNYPELYKHVPADLRVSLLQDGRLPDGSLPTILIRRIVSRELVEIGLKRAIAISVAMIGVLVIVNALDVVPLTYNGAATAIYNHHEAQRQAALNAAEQTFSEEMTAYNNKQQAFYQASAQYNQQMNFYWLRYNEWVDGGRVGIDAGSRLCRSSRGSRRWPPMFSPDNASGPSSCLPFMLNSFATLIW